MTQQKKSDVLLAAIREGKPLVSAEKLNLIIGLSVPSILAQITSVLMFFIDQAMVGRISVEASAACGLVESSTWLFGSLTSAASMGFSVQVAHFIGANDFSKARQVFRHGLFCTLFLSIVIAIVGVSISRKLPFWLGGGADIASDASLYFMVFMLIMPFFQLSNLSGAMLKCSGNMRIPSIMSILMCVMDVVFNYILIFQFHLGVLGVALGTALAIVIGGSVQAWFAIFQNEILSLRRENERFYWVPDYLKHAREHVCHHGREPLLYARLWYRGCRHDAGRAEHGGRSSRHLPYLCLDERRHGYGYHGIHGTADVYFRSRADGTDDPC